MSEEEKKKETDPVEVLMNLKERKPESDKTEQDSGAVKEDEAKPETLADVIREHAIEGEDPHSRCFTLGKILGTAPIRRQIGVFLLITLFAVIYISNRYSCQQYLIQIDNLDKELKDAKYKALSSTSLLTEMCRESRVLEQLRVSKDSTLHISKQPPYIINVPENE